MQNCCGVEDIREAVNDFRTIDIPGRLYSTRQGILLSICYDADDIPNNIAMNNIGKFDELDHQTWVADLIRKRAVYLFVEEIGELVNRLHYKRNIDLVEKDALCQWGYLTGPYRLIRNVMAHNPHCAVKFPGMRAGAYEHLYLAITEAFAHLDEMVENLDLVRV
ncbi:hypothetical protein SeLEV6574_g04216 [Synchytrium endobioticum]|uniref:Uncharacterized protein n=1 Tax=Synchytrium endobioticum TaxID=286115 RepID=A0A507D0C4_9FUNG|nr:hypothetical protein SeLEV6574_g04216 [Synchytrium endobioticum]